MKTEKKFCIISHTHWDREWYLPLEKFKLRLVDIIDELLLIIKENPEFVFHLDAQVIMVEDYLTIRPQNRHLLSQYVKSGNLILGPWYVQNDFYLVSGESTIRNLLIGSRLAEEFSKCGRVAYTPDQFGLISQLPQIYNEFGFTGTIFGRGYDFTDGKKDCEFIWEAPDGSEILAIHMPYWYNNAQRLSESIEKTKLLLNKQAKLFEDISKTPYVMLMNGVDHLTAQENLYEILEKLPSDIDIKQISQEEFISAVSSYVNENNIELKKMHGELRYGVARKILQGTLSSRIDIKVLNFYIQDYMEHVLEPLYSCLELLGFKGAYDRDYFWYLWKLVMENHAHDSIYSCCTDNIAKHIKDRHLRLSEACDEMRDRGMKLLSCHMERTGLTSDNYLITVFNTTPVIKTEEVTITLHLPAYENIKYYELLYHNENIPYEILEKYETNKDMLSSVNLPGLIPCTAYKIRFICRAAEAYSYRSYVIRKSEKQPEMLIDSITKQDCIENEYLRIFSKDNCVCVFDKINLREYNEFFSIEDMGDIGDSYVFLTDGTRRVNKRADKIEIKNRCLTALYHLNIPKEKGGKEFCEIKIKAIFSLTECIENVRISFEIENYANNHRLRALFTTPYDFDKIHASIPFDMVTQLLSDNGKRFRDDCHPNNGVVMTGGLSILTEGQYEYEHINQNTLAVGLLRCHDQIVNQFFSDIWTCPDNRMLGITKSELSFTFKKLSKNEAVNYAVGSRVRLISFFDSVNAQKFAGGRPAVQDTEISEIFYKKDKYPAISLKQERTVLSFDTDCVVSSFKIAENSDDFILRIYNAEEYSGCFRINGLKYSKSNMKEEKIGIKNLETVGSKKISTYIIGGYYDK